MIKVKSCYGYDIMELTREECNKEGLEYPCYKVFDDNADPDEYSCTDAESVQEAEEWCREYRRDYY